MSIFGGMGIKPAAFDSVALAGADKMDAAAIRYSNRTIDSKGNLASKLFEQAVEKYHAQALTWIRHAPLEAIQGDFPLTTRAHGV